MGLGFLIHVPAFITHFTGRFSDSGLSLLSWQPGKSSLKLKMGPALIVKSLELGMVRAATRHE